MDPFVMSWHVSRTPSIKDASGICIFVTPLAQEKYLYSFKSKFVFSHSVLLWLALIQSAPPRYNSPCSIYFLCSLSFTFNPVFKCLWPLWQYHFLSSSLSVSDWPSPAPNLTMQLWVPRRSEENLFSICNNLFDQHTPAISARLTAPQKLDRNHTTEPRTNKIHKTAFITWTAKHIMLPGAQPEPVW